MICSKGNRRGNRWLLDAFGGAISLGHDDWAPVAPEVKSLESALDVRRRILSAFEAAETEADPWRRSAWLTFVVVGAGPAGVEMAGQIAEMARNTAGKVRRERHDGPAWPADPVHPSAITTAATWRRSAEPAPWPTCEA